jgi:hypothetical protein
MPFEHPGTTRNHPDDANRYRHIDVSGSHFEIGQQIGECLKEELRGFVETSWDRIAPNTESCDVKRLECHSSEYSVCAELGS